MVIYYFQDCESDGANDEDSTQQKMGDDRENEEVDAGDSASQVSAATSKSNQTKKKSLKDRYQGNLEKMKKAEDILIEEASSAR